MKSYVKRSDLLRASLSSFEKVGKVSTESVFKNTGKHWNEWVDLLSQAGASTWTHSEIVAFLKTKCRLTPWWQQGVTLGFEIATGRRKPGQDSKGRYMVTATKSLPCGVRELWRALVSRQGQRIWLKPFSSVEIRSKVQFETSDGFFGEVRTVTQYRRVRLSWQDPSWEKPTVVELLLVPRPAKKSILVFNHTGIPDVKTRDLFRIRWRGVADRIPAILRVPTIRTKV